MSSRGDAGEPPRDPSNSTLPAVRPGLGSGFDGAEVYREGVSALTGSAERLAADVGGELSDEKPVGGDVDDREVGDHPLYALDAVNGRLQRSTSLEAPLLEA